MSVLATHLPVTLIGGGPLSRADLDTALRLAPVIAAADGGADQALLHGLVPEAVFGDFDSLPPRARYTIPAERLHRIDEQDSTDFEKSLARIVAPMVLAVGFSGARHDHFLSALNVISRRIGPPCILIAGDDVITLAPPRIGLALEPGTRVSLFPMGSASGRSTGLRWPLEGVDLAPDRVVGTSNEALGPVSLELEGPVLLILPRQCLDRLVAALAASGAVG